MTTKSKSIVSLCPQCGHEFADHCVNGDGCHVEGCKCDSSQSELSIKPCSEQEKVELKKILDKYFTDEPLEREKCYKEIVALSSTLPSTPPLDWEKLKEDIAKWLFTNKYRMPNQRFYHSWYDETAASPLTEKEYLNLANELLAKVMGRGK